MSGTNVLFEKVNKHVNNGETEEAVKILQEALKSNPKDSQALFATIILTIRSDKFSAALKFINQYEEISKDNSSVDFSKAYCLYRLNKLNEAKDIVISSKDKENRQFRNLYAQITLKLEEFDECLKTYSSILSEINESDPEYYELLANYRAAYCGYYQKHSRPYHNTIDSEANNTYELLHNSACIFIAQGDLDSAEKALKEAEELCRSTLENEYTSEELEQELAPILVQAAYVDQLKGNIAKSINAYERIINAKIADEATLSIAFNNYITLKSSDANIVENMHKFLSLTDGDISSRLTKLQRAHILKNQAVLYLHLKKYTSSLKKAKQADLINNNSSFQPIMAASILLNQGKIDKAIAGLKTFNKANPSNIQSAFALAHLFTITNKNDLALSQLEILFNSLEDPSEKYLPGLIGSMVWLYHLLERDQEGDALLSQARDADSSYKEQYQAITRKRDADLKLKEFKGPEAAKIYQELLNENSNDRDALIGLIRALSMFDPDAADQYLGPIPDFGTKADVEAIEKEFMEEHRFKSNFTSLNTIKKAIKIKKNRRHNKPPKNLTAGSKPDPQRWLPLRDRTNVRHRNKKGKLPRGSQGAVVSEKVKELVESKLEEPIKPKGPKKIKKKVKIIKY